MGLVRTDITKAPTGSQRPPALVALKDHWAGTLVMVAQPAEEIVAGVHSVHAEGEGRLAQLMDLVLFGDMVTLYQCEAEGIDPGPVPILDDIKRTLAAPA